MRYIFHLKTQEKSRYFCMFGEREKKRAVRNVKVNWSNNRKIMKISQGIKENNRGINRKDIQW